MNIKSNCMECRKFIYVVEEREFREQIQNLFDISDLDPKELSIYLGFNEDTILRYLEGKIPTKEDSDKLLKVIHNQEPINE